MTTPETGKDVAALCSKCGDVWHVVVAKVGQEIVQVLCKECGGRHRYRNPNKNAAKPAREPGTPRAARAASPVARFDTPTIAPDLSRAVKRYAASELFTVGDRVEHPTFGQGVVELTAEPGKMTVFFATGRRVLVHAKAASTMPVRGGGLERPRPIDHSLPTPGSKPVT